MKAVCVKSYYDKQLKRKVTVCVYGDKVLRDDASAALYFEVGTAADADPINVKITNDTKSPVNTKEVSA